MLHDVRLEQNLFNKFIINSITLADSNQGCKKTTTPNADGNITICFNARPTTTLIFTCLHTLTSQTCCCVWSSNYGKTHAEWCDSLCCFVKHGISKQYFVLPRHDLKRTNTVYQDCRLTHTVHWFERDHMTQVMELAHFLTLTTPKQGQLWLNDWIWPRLGCNLQGGKLVHGALKRSPSSDRVWVFQQFSHRIDDTHASFPPNHGKLRFVAIYNRQRLELLWTKGVWSEWSAPLQLQGEYNVWLSYF